MSKHDKENRFEIWGFPPSQQVFLVSGPSRNISVNRLYAKYPGVLGPKYEIRDLEGEFPTVSGKMVFFPKIFVDDVPVDLVEESRIAS